MAPPAKLLREHFLCVHPAQTAGNIALGQDC